MFVILRKCSVRRSLLELLAGSLGAIRYSRARLVVSGPGLGRVATATGSLLEFMTGRIQREIISGSFFLFRLGKTTYSARTENLRIIRKPFEAKGLLLATGLERKVLFRTVREQAGVHSEVQFNF